MKNNMKTLFFLLVAMSLLSACSGNSNQSELQNPGNAPEAAGSRENSNVWNEDLEGPGKGQHQGGEQNLTGDAGGTYTRGESLADLTEEEAAALLFMREEEKLARDVYLALYDAWDLNIFKNIAGSENQHMEAVLTLLEKYGLDDPSAALADGEFKDPGLQELYQELTSRGQESLQAALEVGALIEEIDIQDLEESLAGTSKPDITQVFSSLLNGSYNHLRAFVQTLERQTGVSYEPEVLSFGEYTEILSAVSERGGGRSGRAGTGRGQADQ